MRACGCVEGMGGRGDGACGVGVGGCLFVSVCYGDGVLSTGVRSPLYCLPPLLALCPSACLPLSP